MRLIFDIESNGLTELQLKGPKKVLQKEADRIWCICAIDIDSGVRYSFGPDKIDEAVDLLSSATLLIGHNIIHFDIPMIERLYPNSVSQVQNVFDTLIASRLMYPDVENHPFGGNSLKAWGIHLGVEKITFKEDFQNYSKDMLVYCEQDVEVTLRVYNCVKHVKEDMPLPFYLEHVSANIISEQMDNGIGFDLHGAHELEQELLMEKACIGDDLNEAFPPIEEEQRYHKKNGKPLKRKIEYFNPGSPAQIAKRFKDKYNWKAPLTDKGNPSVTGKILQGLDYDEAKIIAKYQYNDKLLGFIRDWIIRSVNSRDGRIHSSTNTQGAATGRMTCEQPNLQQVSGDPRARALFRPRDGWVQVGIDAAGLEARLMANRMAKYDDGKFGEIVVNGDFHAANQKAAGLPTRADAKTFYFALIYGAGDAKIGAIVHKNAKAGKEVKDKFFKGMPAMKQVIDNVHFQVAKKKTITLLDGREVPCRAKHSAVNTQIQGDGAVLMKVAQSIFYKKLETKYPESQSFMITVHDEWQVECDPLVADDVAALGCESIKEAGQFLKCKVPMEGDAKIGNNWKECH